MFKQSAFIIVPIYTQNTHIILQAGQPRRGDV